MSSERGRGFDAVIRGIDSWRMDGDSVYVIGCTNVGKSTFVNALQRAFGGARDRLPLLTQSPVPGTTLGVVEVPIGRKAIVVDTPGIQLGRQVTDHLNAEELKHVIPRKDCLTGQALRIVPGKTIVAGGLARFDYLAGPPLLVTPFFSNGVNVHATSIATATAAVRGSTVYTPPFTPERAAALPPLASTIVDLASRVTSPNEEGKAFADIYVGGLGWISLTMNTWEAKKNPAASFEVWTLPNTMVSARDPLLPFEAAPSIRESVKKVK